MGIWQELLSSIIFAVVSAFLVAKLIALVVCYKYPGSSPTTIVYENESFFSEFTWDRVTVHENFGGEHGLSPEKVKVRQIHMEDAVSGDVFSSEQSNEFVRDEKCGEKYFKPEDEVVFEKKPKEVDFLKENVEFYFPDEISNKNVEDVSLHAGLLVKEELEKEQVARNIRSEEKKEFRITDTSLLSDEDEWEKVDNSELDEIFGEATVYVSSMAANLSQKISNEVQTRLDGLHKIITEGPSDIPQPSPLKMDAQAKWKLEEDHSNAKERYAPGLLKLSDQEVPVDSRDMEGQMTFRSATV